MGFVFILENKEPGTCKIEGSSSVLDCNPLIKIYFNYFEVWIVVILHNLYINPSVIPEMSIL